MADEPRTEGQRELDYTFIADRYVKGHSLRQIAKDLSAERDYDLSHVHVMREVRVILERWRSEYLSDIDDMKAAELAKLNEVEREAWDEWRRTKDDARVKEIAERKDGKEAYAKAQMVTETGFGDPRYLQVIQSCIKQRSDILGLNAPAKHEHQVRTWADIIKSIGADDDEDTPDGDDAEASD